MRRIEAHLSAWEAANPAEAAALPWFEARQAFKAQQAAGTVVWPTWWELAGAVAELGYVVPKLK